MNDRVNRRDFIRTTAVAAGGLAAGLGGNFLARAEDKEAVEKTRSHNSEMEYRRLGNTGLWVSAVLLGCGGYESGQGSVAGPDYKRQNETFAARNETWLYTYGPKTHGDVQFKKWDHGHVHGHEVAEDGRVYLLIRNARRSGSACVDSVIKVFEIVD